MTNIQLICPSTNINSSLFRGNGLTAADIATECKLQVDTLSVFAVVLGTNNKDPNTKYPHSYLPSLPGGTTLYVEGTPTAQTAPADALSTVIGYQPPHSLVNTSGIEWVYQESKEDTKMLKDGLLLKYQQRSSGKSPDKAYNPIFMSFGGPGSGKSRRLNEFLRRCRFAVIGTEAEGLMKNKFYEFHISLENGTPFLAPEDTSGQNIIGRRMMLQLTGTMCNVPPAKIIQRLSEIDGVPSSEVYVSIVVDGIHNIPEEQNRITEELYRCIQGLVNHRDWFVLVNIAGTYYSTRWKKFISTTGQLTPYTYTNEIESPRRPNGELVIPEKYQLLLTDCGGVARLIEMLETAINQCSQESEDYDKIATLVIEQARNRYSYTDIGVDEVKYVLAAALGNIYVTNQTNIPGTKSTIEDYTTAGIFRLVEGHIHIPFFFFWMMTDKLPVPELRELRMRSWNDYMKGGEASGEGSPMAFEWTTARFRALKSYLFNGQEKTIRELHAGAEWSKNLSDNTNTIVHVTSTPVKLLPHHVDLKKITESVDEYAGKICMNASAAPYADIFIKHPNMVEAIQPKRLWSTRVSDGIITEEVDKTFGRTPQNKDALIIISPGLTTGKYVIPPHVGLVHSGNYIKYFGPFAGRAHRLFVDRGVNMPKSKFSTFTRPAPQGCSLLRNFLQAVVRR